MRAIIATILLLTAISARADWDNTSLQRFCIVPNGSTVTGFYDMLLDYSIYTVHVCYQHGGWYLPTYQDAKYFQDLKDALPDVTALSSLGGSSSGSSITSDQLTYLSSLMTKFPELTASGSSTLNADQLALIGINTDDTIKAFVFGASAIFSLWGLGFAVATARKLIKSI